MTVASQWLVRKTTVTRTKLVTSMVYLAKASPPNNDNVR